MENLSIRFSNNTPDGCLMSIYYVPFDRYACYRYVGAAISLVLWHCVFFFLLRLAVQITSNSAAADKCTRAAGPTCGGKCIDDTATEVRRFYRDETTSRGHEVTSTGR